MALLTPTATDTLVTLNCGHVHFEPVDMPGPRPQVGDQRPCWSACDAIGRLERHVVRVDEPGTVEHELRLPAAGSTASYRRH